MPSRDIRALADSADRKVVINVCATAILPMCGIPIEADTESDNSGTVFESRSSQGHGGLGVDLEEELTLSGPQLTLGGKRRRGGSSKDLATRILKVRRPK